MPLLAREKWLLDWAWLQRRAQLAHEEISHAMRQRRVCTGFASGYGLQHRRSETMAYEVTLTIDPDQSEWVANDKLVPVTRKLNALTRGLGWFSIALGLSEVFAPRQLSRAIGVPPRRDLLLPLLGVRELVSGVGILARRDQATTWIKSRVLGDIVDLSLLGAAFTSRKRDPVRLAVATAAVAGVTLLDILCARGRRAA
jgi:hypothetical protein